jgi:nitrite reductase/ring-hydroxylating ferredoxin subunit
MISRRGVIASAVGVSAVAALSACSTEVTELTSTPKPEAPATTGPVSVAVAKTSDIPIGSGKKFDVEGVPILITQPRAGQFRGFSAVCTHAGFVMSNVANSKIKCDNHGAVYSADDGSVLSGPAPRALGKVTVTVEGDDVLVSF